MSLPPDDSSQIRQLLLCKRLEQPPLGFFENFSDRVIARIEADDTAQYSSWWSWLMEKFDARPVVACIYGVSVSSLLFAGLRLSSIFEAEMAEMASTPHVVNGPWLATSPGSSSLFSLGLSEPAAVPAPELLTGSFAPAFRGRSSAGYFHPQSAFQPVSFSLSGP
jgi:hypothetical protein